MCGSKAAAQPRTAVIDESNNDANSGFLNVDIHHIVSGTGGAVTVLIIVALIYWYLRRRRARRRRRDGEGLRMQELARRISAREDMRVASAALSPPPPPPQPTWASAPHLGQVLMLPPREHSMAKAIQLDSPTSGRRRHTDFQ